MRRISCWLSALALLVPASSAAGQRATQLQFAAAYEHLSNGYDPWRTATLELRTSESGLSAHARVEETMRFSQLDHNVTLGVQRRVTSRFTVGGGAQVSPSHRVSPRWAALGDVEFAGRGGWGAQAAVRQLQYTSAPVTISATTVERYVSRYRAAYSLYAARFRSAGSIGHRVRGDVYYGRSSSSVGVALSLGDEVESTLPNGVLRTSVRGAGVVGRQWLTPRWRVIYDALVQQQGALYTRRRIAIGLERRF
jgi:YaiO family outer membrane protein